MDTSLGLSAGISPEVKAILYLLRREINSAESSNNIQPPYTREPVDWTKVLSIVKTQEVLPLIHRSMKALGDNNVPVSFIEAVRKEFYRNGLLIHMQMQSLVHVWNTFKATSVPILFLKGPALGEMAYGNPIWRKPGDIDVLINSADYQNARDILTKSGYKPHHSPHVEKKIRLRGSEMVFSRDGFEVDLHWSLEQSAFNRFPFSPGFDEEEIWERSTTCVIDGESIPCLSYEDTLFFLCAHGGKHAWTYLYMICDIAMLISGKKDIDWDRMIGLAEKLNTERVTYLGLYLAHKICLTSLPREVLRAIGRHPNMETLTQKVTNYLFRSVTSVNAFQYHVIRAGLLNRGHEKALYGLYLFNRKAKKISESLISG